MDIDVDEELPRFQLTFPEESDDELQSENNEPWQCGLTNLQERAMALLRTSNFTDITLTFPGSDTTYDAHCLILAMSSPVFEGILYGPMRTEEEKLELHGDDPSIMLHVVAYCYGYDLDIPDMDTTLEVYKLADKYILDDLKNHCCKHIVRHMSKDNVKDVIEFAEKFNFTDFLKYNCIPYFKEMFEDIQDKHKESKCYENEPDYTETSAILMDLNDDWIQELLPEVCVRVLDFPESWKYPESPLIFDRVSTILASGGCNLDKFYGCINAEHVHQFYVEHFGLNSYTLELCLSVTDLNHAKRVIEAINYQTRFEKHLIALHIRCEEVWPRNWSPIPKGRIHRPSMLLISDTDDDKVAWVIEAAKALLPRFGERGSSEMALFTTKTFRYNGRYDDDGDRYVENLKPNNILKLPRSRFTPNGMSTLLQGLNNSGMIFTVIILQSPYISNAQEIPIQYHSLPIQCLPMDHNFFRKVFEDFQTVGPAHVLNH